MNKQEQIAAVSRPQLARMKDLGMGLRIGTVWGTRVLIQPIEPYTDMDRVKKEGLLVIPEAVEAQNRPKPCTGIIVQLGEGVKNNFSTPVGKDGEEDIIPEIDWPLREGYMVMYGKYAGSEFIIDQVEYRIMDVSEIMCTLYARDVDAYAPVTD